MRQLRIVHLSDLHARASSDFDQSLLVERFLVDIETRHSHREVDLVVFGGDLAFAGKPEDFELGRQRLLEPLAATIGVGAERTVLVPGNHDVDRDRIDKVYETGLATTLTTREAGVDLFREGGQVRHAIDRMAAWHEFTTRYYDGVQRHYIAPLAWTRSLVLGGVSVGIAALDSAWRSTGAGETERGMLLIGDHQVRSALEQIAGCDVRLVVVHHPLEWMADFDARGARTEFERAGAIILTGHEHQADPTHSISGCGSAIYARAGCLYQSVDYPNSYSVIDVDVDRQEVAVAVRTWQVTRRVFDAGVNIADAGVVQLPLPQPELGAASIVAHADVTNTLVEVVQRNSVVADLIASAHYSSVGELLVAPRFYPAPYGELCAASRAEGGGKIERADGLAAVASTRVVVVSADPQSGVTGALAWLLEHRHAADHSLVPLFLRFSERQGKQVLDEDLREAAARTGARIPRTAPVPPALIAVDDVTGDNLRALDRLVRHIIDHPENRYVLGCHGAAQVAVTQTLKAGGIDPCRLFLGPFGRRELKQLVRKVVPSASTTLVDKILEVLGENRLPRNPFLMAALTAVLHDRPEAIGLSATVIVDRYVDLLLGRAELVGADFLDFRKRERLLEHLAGELTRRATWCLPRGDGESLVGQYFRNRGDHRVSPGRVIDRLIERRVLAQDDGDIAFRHPALQELFAAKLTLDDSIFAEEVSRDPVGHAAIVRHRAALRLDDRPLLAAVGAAVREVVAEASHPWGDAVVETLMDIGRLVLPTPAGIRERLRATAPPPPDVVEAMIDELYERLGTVAPESLDSAPIEGIARLFTAVDLLSGVVLSSELVEDVELRVELLKDALRGWAVSAVALLRQQDETGTLSEIVRKTLLRDVPEAEVGQRLKKTLRLAVMLNLSLQVVVALGSRQTRALLPDVLDDKEFMANSIHALLAVLLACVLRLPGWHRRLIQLRERHHTRAFVCDITETIALARYQSTVTTDFEAAALEKFLIDIHTEAISGNRGRRRQLMRSQVQGELRKSRARALLGASASDLLADDLADEPLKVGEANGMDETA